MSGFVMFIHAGVCFFLVLIILMQSGRGGGLTESFSYAESMFGTKTNDFLIKSTTVFAILYFVTCLSLAIFSTSKGRSLMPSRVATQTKESRLPNKNQILDFMESGSSVKVDLMAEDQEIKPESDLKESPQKK